MTSLEAKPEQTQNPNLTLRLKKLIESMVARPNILNYARPELDLREYTFEDGLQAVDEHRKAAYGRIDADFESGKITPVEAQNQKHSWNIQHGYRGRNFD
jgi:hypothetical protein